MKVCVTSRRITLPIIFITLSFCAAVLAQGFHFGRNKVQYNDFKWQIMKTRHFDIYYYPEMEQLSEKAAFFAEKSYRYLENKFNFTINRRIPLILYSSHLHFQQTNTTPGFIPEGVGGFFEFLKGRVVIPSDGNINMFRKVIQHELVHVFMHAKVYFVNKEHARFNGTSPPLWFTEGLAEYWSGGWDAQAEMVIKDAVLNNYIVPLSRLYTISGSFTMYKEGQAILSYISKRYGEEKILLLMENIWKYGKFSEVFRDVIGKSYREFDQEWLYYLKKRYYPLLKNHDFSRMITKTIVKNGFNFKPAYYKDEQGEKVVFVANRIGYANIYMTDLRKPPNLKKKPVKVLVKGERSSQFETFHLFSSKIDVSADGRLVFSSKSGANDALYIYHIPSEKIVRKFQWKDIVGISSPSFSPDGKKVVFSGLEFNGNKDLYLLNLRTDELTKLTNDFYDDMAPSFSPDGKMIVFSSDRTVYGSEWSYNIFVYDLETHLTYYVTAGRFQDNTPVWSPNGKYICFTSDRDSSLNLWIADVSKVSEWRPDSYLSIPVKQISRFANAAFDPEWADNDRLMFAVYENRQFQIRLMDKVQERFLDSRDIAYNSQIPNRIPWRPGQLAGNTKVERSKYHRKYQLDVAQSQVSQDAFWGTTGGAAFAFTDLLGNDQLYATIYNNATTRSDLLKSFNFAVTRVSLRKRTNYAYGLFRFSGRFYNFKDGFFFEDRFGGFFSVSYPFSQFRRLEFTTNFSYSDKNFVEGRRFALLTSNSISYVKDNSIWSYTGPVDGARYKITLQNTYDVKYSNVNYYTFLADFRKYFRLSPRLTYAVRMMTLMNAGKETRWFAMGGSWDLRGYRRFSIRGEKIILFSQELRFPFIDYLDIKFPFGGLGFRSIRGALFFDAGNAWNNRWNGLLGSAGFGLRLNLGGFLVLRLDMGKKTDFNSVSPHWFTQFFFGWDF